MDAKLKTYKNRCFHQVQRSGLSINTLILFTTNKHFKMDVQKCAPIKLNVRCYPSHLLFSFEHFGDIKMKKLKIILTLWLTLYALSLFASEEASSYIANIGIHANIQGLERVKQNLVAPPFLPKHQQKYSGKPRIIDIEMVIKEKEIEIEPGVFVQAMTFNGTNPGPIIVVHEGDYVELTLKNPKTNVLLHNIDFHAATGALGGGALTKVSPGEQVVLRFKADKPGTYLYHCAPGGMMIPYHVVSGMYGAIMILPKDGLKDNSGKPVFYDSAYYIGEQGWYIPKDENGKYKRNSTL